MTRSRAAPRSLHAYSFVVTSAKSHTIETTHFCNTPHTRQGLHHRLSEWRIIFGIQLPVLVVHHHPDVVAPRRFDRRHLKRRWPQRDLSKSTRNELVPLVPVDSVVSILIGSLQAQQRAGKSEARTADISRHRRLTRAPTLRLETCVRRR